MRKYTIEIEVSTSDIATTCRVSHEVIRRIEEISQELDELIRIHAARIEFVEYSRKRGSD